MISFKIIKIVSIFLRDKGFFFNRDFIFKSKMKKMYSHFVNASFDFVNVRNDFIYSFLISHYQKMSIIIKYKIQKNN